MRLRTKLLASLGLVALLGAGTAAYAQFVNVTNFGAVTVGAGVAGPLNTGDVSITGAFRQNGNPILGTQSATTGLSPIPLTMANMKTVAGLQMTGSASGTNFGLVYTPATGTYLTGTATSSGSTSDVASYDVVLPPWYVAGTNITVKAACYYTTASGAATVETLAAAAYLNNTTTGAQGSTLIATAAQNCPVTTAAQQTFTITGATLVPGSYLTLTFSAAVTNSTGASTEFVTGVTLN